MKCEKESIEEERKKESIDEVQRREIEEARYVNQISEGNEKETNAINELAM